MFQAGEHRGLEAIQLKHWRTPLRLLPAAYTEMKQGITRLKRPRHVHWHLFCSLSLSRLFVLKMLIATVSIVYIYIHAYLHICIIHIHMHIYIYMYKYIEGYCVHVCVHVGTCTLHLPDLLSFRSSCAVGLRVAMTTGPRAGPGGQTVLGPVSTATSPLPSRGLQIDPYTMGSPTNPSIPSPQGSLISPIKP